MNGVLASEWLKLRSVRSTYYILGVLAVFVGLTMLLAWYAATTWDHLPPGRQARFALAPEAELTGWVASLCLAVLGVLTVTSEYATGLIRVSLTAVPRRRAVLAAKAAVVAAVGLVAGEASVLTTFFAARWIIGGRPIRGQPAGPVADQLPLLLATGLSVMVFALVGLGLGAVVRSAAAAIAILVGLWYVLPIVVHNLPAPWNDRIGSFMPSALAGQLAGTGNEDSIYGAMLPPPAALAVMVVYAVVPLGVAACLLTRRDV